MVKVENDEKCLVFHIKYWEVIILFLVGGLGFGVAALFLVFEVIALVSPYGNEAAMYLYKVSYAGGTGILLILLVYLCGRSLLYRRKKNAV